MPTSSRFIARGSFDLQSRPLETPSFSRPARQLDRSRHSGCGSRPSRSARRPRRRRAKPASRSLPRPRRTISTASSPRSVRYRRADVLITFLTDFGLEDDFVGTCHGVMKRIAPDVEIIDITHGIQPQSVLQGALVLANTLPYLPEGVHLAVVDPGVGGDRREIAISGENGRIYVGPDNGLLVPAAEKLGGIQAAHEISNRQYALEPVSATFHGRDVFSPAAAHLARGLDIAELGPALEIDSLSRLEVPKADVTDRRIRAC